MKRPFAILPLTLPPPVHGMSMVNAQVLEALKKTDTEIKVINLSAGSLRRCFSYHLKRIVAVAKSCINIIYHRAIRPKEKLTIYTVIDGGLGAYYSLLIIFIANICWYKIFLHHHSSRHTLRPSNICKCIVKSSPRATHVALSVGMKNDLQRHYSGIGEVIISENTCHIKKSKVRESKQSNSTINLGMLSNLTVEKGTVRAIETAILAHKEGIDITLTLAGPIIDHEVEQSIEKARAILGKRIIVTGAIYGDEKDDFFKNIDVFIFPTQYINEAQPLVILEALSFGCGIITTNQGYISDIISDGNHMLAVDNDFPKTAVSTLKNISVNPDYNQRHFLSLHKRADQQFQQLISMISGMDK